MSALSRALLRAAVSRTSVRPVSTTSVKNTAGAWVDGIDIFENEKNPERDHVNFPRRAIKEMPDPVRHWWVPEEYFQFFHSKTGVTGPYMFAISLGTYMSSKEVFVYEHDFYAGLAVWTIFIAGANMFGADVAKSLDAQIDADKAELDSIRQREIDRCSTAVEEEEKSQWMAGSYEELIAAKKENVALQLEAEYRARIKDAFTQVKKRLDYQLQTANVLRANEQKHMVNWIIENVKKSITAKQEEDALKKCVADLKALAK